MVTQVGHVDGAQCTLCGFLCLFRAILESLMAVLIARQRRKMDLPSQILTNTYTCVRQYEPWLPHGIKLGHCVNLNQITKQNLHRHGTRYFKNEQKGEN